MRRQVILLGLMDRPEGRAALTAARDWARLIDARLHVLRLFSFGQTENPSKERDIQQDIERFRMEGKQLVSELAAEGLDASFEVQPSNMSHARALLESANEWHADLIVIGLRRRSPVGKLVLGSVSQEVLLGADCPVLAIKAPRHSDAAAGEVVNNR